MNGFFFYLKADPKETSKPEQVWFVRTQDKRITERLLAKIIRIAELEDSQYLRMQIAYSKRDGTCTKTKWHDNLFFKFEYDDGMSGYVGLSPGTDRNFVVDVRQRPKMNFNFQKRK